MGRKLTLPLFIATLVATWYGGIFGVTQMAYEKGIYNFLTQGVFWYLTYLIFAFFLVEKIRSSKALTLPDMVGKEFGEKSRKISAFLNLMNVIPISYAISVGLFLNIIFGISVPIGTAVGVTFVMLYSTSGGLRAVVYSDIIQFFVMIISVALILYFSVVNFGGPTYLKDHLPVAHLTLSGNQGIWTTIMWGVIALSTLVDPNFYQRCLAAKDIKTAKNGILISTIVWILFDLCTTFGALYARAYRADLPPGTAYLTYAMEILPNGFRGFILAGILATIISTLDSYIFLGATTMVNDLFEKKIVNKVRAHHISAILIGVCSIVLSYLFKGNIIKVWKLLGGMSSSCLLIPIIIGRIFPKKIRDREFFYSSLAGIIFIISWNIISNIFDTWTIDDLYIGVLGSLSVLSYFVITKNHSQA